MHYSYFGDLITENGTRIGRIGRICTEKGEKLRQLGKSARKIC